LNYLNAYNIVDVAYKFNFNDFARGGFERQVFIPYIFFFLQLLEFIFIKNLFIIKNKIKGGFAHYLIF